ncbi:uncharacterized protein [Typha latifolia]|uniref:uncharacterized protein n=1 Tax=Typha latifolia TaxID=4733 RepID=UPI003C2AF458
MALEYEWGNPAAAAAAMLLFGEDSGSNTGHEQAISLDHYGGHITVGDYFPQPQPLTAAALFPASLSSASSSYNPRYGLALPPPPTRIGLNLGLQTYFSSAPREEELVLGPRICRRRTRTARCQAEGCGAELTHAKNYHRRHKVCEFHSKASIVLVAGLSQRFCQQCSRFHVLSEFDQGKRSCRKRLADHNRRRRKSQDLSTAIISSQPADNTTNSSNSSVTTTNSATKPEKDLFNTNFSNGNNNNNNNHSSASLVFMAGCNPHEMESSVTHVSSPLGTPSPPMALGLGCGGGGDDIGGILTTSSTGTSATSISFLQRFPGWD